MNKTEVFSILSLLFTAESRSLLGLLDSAGSVCTGNCTYRKADSELSLACSRLFASKQDR